MKLKPTELTAGDRQALTTMTYHPGFTVLRRLMEVRVQFATVQMLEVAPDDSDREKKISALQAQAYARNAFCEELMRDIQYQVQAELSEDETEPEEDENLKRLRTALTSAGYLTMETKNGIDDRNTDT